MEKLKLAVIGLGGRGQGMMQNLLDMDDTYVAAVCDRYPDRAEEGAKRVRDTQNHEPAVYTDFRELLAAPGANYDAVFVFTSWNNHIVPALAAMEAGFDVAFEVGGAYSVDECYELVHMSERTGKRCMLLENCCYGREEMAVLRMIHEGVFGELVYCAGGYEHDLRDEITMGHENRHYRYDQYKLRNGEIYPTHHMGPICKFLDINRGNRFLSLSCQTSKSVGLNAWAKEHLPEGHSARTESFKQGDVAITTIKCARGEIVTSTHDTSLPRPYSRGGRVQGTKAIWSEEANGIFVEGQSASDDKPSWEHSWDSFPAWREKYEHPLWKWYDEIGVRGGHGGMDYLVLRSFLGSVRNNTRTPIDVYDTAVMMAITCLSEQSAAMGGLPVAFPDFTHGAWINPEWLPRIDCPEMSLFVLDR